MEKQLILVAGLLFSLTFWVLGIAVRWFRAYRLIAGYNTASAEEKKKYDIEGLADHLGNGLIVIGAFSLLATLSAYTDQVPLAIIFVTGIVFVAFIMVVGGQKFLPKCQHPEPGFEIHAQHRFLKKILPAKAFAAIKRGTQNWMTVCPCGEQQDFWEVGGVRYKACGEKITSSQVQRL